DPRMVTSVRERSADGAVVVAFAPPPYGEGDEVLWHTPDAFSIDTAPPAAPATRIASGKRLAGASPVRAAIGVRDAAGMLVYLEVAEGVPAAAVLEVFASLGCSEAIALEAPLPLALGGDTALGGAAVRLEGEAATLWRKAGPSGRRIFEQTPVVPLDVWHPLQSRRIRYFKKKDT